MRYLTKVYLKTMGLGFLLCCLWGTLRWFTGPPHNYRDWPGDAISVIFLGVFFCPAYQKFRKDTKTDRKTLRILNIVLALYILAGGIAGWYSMKHYIEPWLR